MLCASHNSDLPNHDLLQRLFCASEQLTPSHPLLLRLSVNSVPSKQLLVNQNLFKFLMGKSVMFCTEFIKVLFTSTV
jgi:hypothetical protein